MLFILISLLLVSENVLAKSYKDYTVSRCTDCYDTCFLEAGSKFNIPPVILKAIAETESNMNPYAVNTNRDGSKDYGLMQINTFWRKYLPKNVWKNIFDPCVNIHVGAYVLSKCVKDYGLTWQAIDCYNKGKSRAERDSRYVRNVYKRLKKYIKR
ncbi:lytic transglycosylase domain-containing protein [Deferribacter thermophilus]